MTREEKLKVLLENGVNPQASELIADDEEVENLLTLVRMAGEEEESRVLRRIAIMTRVSRERGIGPDDNEGLAKIHEEFHDI